MKPQRIYIITVLAWLCILAVDAARYLSVVLAALPSSEVYANSLGFQLIAHALTRGPYFVVALVCIMLIEFALFGRKPQSHGPQA